jgi:hypothetical protein
MSSQQQWVSGEGTFRGVIYEYWLTDAKESKSIGVSYRAELHENYDFESGQWIDWRESNVIAQGASWVVGKEGQLNNRSIESLIQNCDWDGDFSSVSNGTWKPTPCQFVIKPNTFNGKTTFQIAFLNGYDNIPGGRYEVAEEKVGTLKSEYGSQMRALAGQFKRNTKPPATSKPASPPKAKQAISANSTGGDPDVPF